MLEDTSDFEKLDIGKWLIIGANILVVIASVCFHFSDAKNSDVQTVKDTLPIVSALLIACSEFYVRVEQKVVLNNVLKGKIGDADSEQILSHQGVDGILKAYLGNYANNSLPPKEETGETHEKRIKVRKLLICSAVIVLGAGFFFSVFYRIQYLFVAMVCVCSIIYIYIDYFGHVRTYARNYDGRFVRNGKNTHRGLARLYLEEYKKTKFDRKHNFYEEIQKEEHSFECKKQILNMSLDHINNIGLILGIILMFLNIMLLFPQTEKYLVDLFAVIKYGRMDDFLYNMAYFVVILGTGILNWYSCTQRKSLEESTEKALMTYIDEEDKFNKNFERKKGLFNSLILCRGIFQYSMKCLDETEEGRKKDIEEIDWQDRMLFIHRMYTHVPRLNLTIILGCLTFFFVSMEIWGLQIWYLIYLVLAIFLRFILKNFYLPIAGKKSISKWCEKLVEQQEIGRRRVK